MIKLVCFVSSTLLSHTTLPEDEHEEEHQYEGEDQYEEKHEYVEEEDEHETVDEEKDEFGDPVCFDKQAVLE